MFDDLRNESQSSQFSNDDIEGLLDSKTKKEPKPAKSGKKGKFLGMTAGQRLILSFLLFSVTCLGGILTLVAIGAIVIF